MACSMVLHFVSPLLFARWSSFMIRPAAARAGLTAQPQRDRPVVRILRALLCHGVFRLLDLLLRLLDLLARRVVLLQLLQLLLRLLQLRAGLVALRVDRRGHGAARVGGRAGNRRALIGGV